MSVQEWTLELEETEHEFFEKESFPIFNPHETIIANTKSVKKTILSYPNPLLPITYFPIGLANSNKGRCTANIYSVLRPK